jgi:hypothetical protein
MNKHLLKYEQSQWLYIVWVGGVDDYYATYAQAKEHYDEWIEKGYDDVVLDCWDTFHKKFRTLEQSKLKLFATEEEKE